MGRFDNSSIMANSGRRPTNFGAELNGDQGEGDDQGDGGQEDQGVNNQVTKIALDKITRATQAQVKQEVLAEFMRDADFAELLRARAEGRKVKISSLDPNDGSGGQGKQDQDQNQAGLTGLEEEPNYDEMNNRQLMGHFLKTVKPMLQGTIKSMLTPVVQELQEVKGYAKQHEQQQISQQVDGVRKKYNDFDSYADTMVSMSEANPNLTAEDLYILAKSRSGQLVPKASRAASERPSTVIANSQNRKPRSHTSEAIRMAVRNTVNGLVDANPNDFLEQ